MTPLPDEINERTREIINRPIEELVALGLEGGSAAAQHMLAFHMILRLDTAGEIEKLMHLRQEIDDAIEAAQAEAGGLQ
jgi:hypothetical protein